MGLPPLFFIFVGRNRRNIHDNTTTSENDRSPNVCRKSNHRHRGTASSFELQDRLNEPLTGRKFEYHLYPISTAEIMESQGLLGVKQTLEQRLIYGSYPDIVNHAEDAKELLMNLAGSYLYKDLLSLESVRRPVLLGKLLTALALQVCGEVSYNELAQTIGTDNKTVEKYIDLLEKCYIVFRLNGF